MLGTEADEVLKQLTAAFRLIDAAQVEQERWTHDSAISRRQLIRFSLSRFVDADTHHGTGSLEAEFLRYQTLFLGSAKDEAPGQGKKPLINRQMKGRLVMCRRHQKAAACHTRQAKEGQAVGVGEEKEDVE